MDKVTFWCAKLAFCVCVWRKIVFFPILTIYFSKCTHDSLFNLFKYLLLLFPSSFLYFSYVLSTNEQGHYIAKWYFG